MDEDTCMVDVAKYFLSFTTNESCGKCIPCREGTQRMCEILEKIVSPYSAMRSEEENLLRFNMVMNLENLANVIKSTSLCGLGQGAPNPVLSTLKYFREEYEAHIYDRSARRTSARGCSPSRSRTRSAAAARCAPRSARCRRSWARRRRPTTFSRTSAPAAAPATTCASSARWRSS